MAITGSAAACYASASSQPFWPVGLALGATAAPPGLSRGSPIGARSIAPLFLSGELLLGKLSEAAVVVGNAPHNRPRFLVAHLVGNRSSFLCTEAPLRRVPDELSGMAFPRTPKDEAMLWTT